MQSERELDIIDLQPIRLKNLEDGEAWYKTDRSFLIPEQNILFKFYSEKLNTIEQYEKEFAKETILESVLNSWIQKKMYQAFTMRNKITVQSGYQGMSFYISGYDESVSKMFGMLLENINSLEYDEREFDLLKSSIVE